LEDKKENKLTDKETISKVVFSRVFSSFKKGDRVKCKTKVLYTNRDRVIYGNVIRMNEDGTVIWVEDRTTKVKYTFKDDLIPVLTRKTSWKGQIIDWEKTKKLSIEPSGLLISYWALYVLAKKNAIKLKTPRPEWCRAF